jgi:hypothetical protein
MTGRLLGLLFGRGEGEDDPRLTAFVRGLVLGALAGAAIAGSRLWTRRGNRPPPR